MPRNEFSPDVATQGIFPSPLNAGILFENLARHSFRRAQAEQALSGIEGDTKTPLPEKQPEVSGDLIEAIPVEPAQMIADLRDASLVFSSMADPF